MTTHDLYTKHADTIESVLAFTCRKHRLSPDDADEFSSHARLRLLQDDCAILRKHTGVASFRGFIVVVITNQFLDWRIKEWGKWRPTPRAKKLGRIAVELERLVLRDDVPYEQAVQELISKGLAESEAQCDALWGQLRQKGRRRRAGLDGVDPPAPTPPDLIDAERRRQLFKRAIEAMFAAIAALGAQDQLIFRLRYQDHFKVGRIAELVGEDDPKRLYRRCDDIRARLQKAILATGITEDEMDDLFGEAGFDFDDDEDDGSSGGGNAGGGPSMSVNAGGVSV